MSAMLCTGATSVKKSSCLVNRIVSFDTVGLHLFTFRILESYPSKDILTLMVYKSYLNQCFYVSELLKYDGNVMVT